MNCFCVAMEWRCIELFVFNELLSAVANALQQKTTTWVLKGILRYHPILLKQEEALNTKQLDLVKNSYFSQLTPTINGHRFFIH